MAEHNEHAERERHYQEALDAANDAKGNDRPLTANGLLKWSGFLFICGSAFLSFVWFVANIKGDLTFQKQDHEVLKKQFEERKAAVDKRQDAFDLRQNNTDKAITELQVKLDVAITILNRIDAKSGRP